MTAEVTPDGYLIVKTAEPRQVIRGVMCDVCKMKFEYNQAYGYHCGNMDCPMRNGTVQVQT